MGTILSILALVVLAILFLLSVRGCTNGCYHNLCKRRGNGVASSITVVGVTGPPAAGKSLFGAICAEKGVDVIDTDLVVHQLMRTDDNVKGAIRARFGNEIFDADGAIDRKKLGKLVFNDKPARHDLEAILHPLTILECRKQIKALAQSGKRLVIVQVPLLFEAKLEKEYDLIVAVVVEETLLRARLKGRNLSDAEVTERLAAQMPQQEKARRADYVIDNSGTIEELRQKIYQFITDLAA